jgi:chaperonin GroEL (HSP60 family)
MAQPQYNEFVCKDVRDIQVSCAKSQWQYLIKHKEMEECQGVVKAIIESPSFINQSKTDKKRQTYYKQLVLPKIGSTYVRVVVEFRETDGQKRGYVINAFACNGPQKGEKLIWQKN